jgi:hypothetical protein
VPKTEGALRALVLKDLARSGLTAEYAKLKLEPLDAVATKKLTGRDGASYKIPYFTLDGRPSKFYRIRFLDPQASFGAPEKVEKYWQAPNTPPALYLSPSIKWRKLARDVSVPLYITEGEKKAAAACKVGLACVGLGGVWSWCQRKKGVALIPDFQQFEWRGRRVVIVFDSDVAEKPEVQQAMLALAEQLVTLGASPETIKLAAGKNGEKQGLDDLLVAKGSKAFQALTPEPLLGDLGRELWKMNDEFCYLEELETILRFGTQGLLNRQTLIGVTCANRNVTIFDAATGKPRSVNVAEEWLRWPYRRTHKRMSYLPGQARITEDGTVNTWPGWGVTPERGDVTLLAQLIDHLFQNAEEHKRWFWQWLAYPLQKPGTKLYTAVMFHSVGTGVGKSLVFLTLKKIYGENFAEVGNEQLHGRNDWAANKQFVLGDEIVDTDRRRDADRITRMITRETAIIDVKYRPVYQVKDCANYGFTSNHPDAWYLIGTDRRAFIHEVPKERLPAEFYTKYDKWYRSAAGAAAVFWHLLNAIDISTFNPHAEAPATAAKTAMIELSRSDLDGWAVELFRNPDGVLRLDSKIIARQLVTTQELLRLYDPDGTKRTNLIAMSKALRRAGFSPPIAVSAADGSHKLWAVREVATWARASHHQFRDQYEFERNLEKKPRKEKF